jgi:hypothetical protein
MKRSFPHTFHRPPFSVRVASMMANRELVDAFRSMTSAYDADVDTDDVRLVPDKVRRPSRYASLRVVVPKEGDDFEEEWKAQHVQSVYPNLPSGGREERLAYLRARDEDGFVVETLQGEAPPLPPAFFEKLLLCEGEEGNRLARLGARRQRPRVL